MSDKQRKYYEARGFSVYYFANAVFNIVANAGSYLRGLEEILGDLQTEVLMRPFHRFTNLHHFLDAIVREIVEEEVGQLEDEQPRFLRQFLLTVRVPFAAHHLKDEESFYEFTSECQRYHDALEELGDEVFHVLFNDVGFLQNFNVLCADYIERSGLGAELRSKTGHLRRTAIPVWAQRAIYHRDKGECRECKRSLAATITQLETERYDHIVPLARFGANDVTNLQLLCEPCNLRKSSAVHPVSKMYQRAIIPR